MVVDAVVQGDDRVDRERPLHGVRVVLVQAELTIAAYIVRVVRGILVILVLHEVQIPAKNAKRAFDQWCGAKGVKGH